MSGHQDVEGEGTGVRRRMLPLLVLAGTLALGACGGDDVTVEPGSPGVPTSEAPGEATSNPPTSSPPATTAPTQAAGEPLPAELTVVVDESGSGQTSTWTLTCLPPGGDHPDPAAACASVAAASVETFQPLPDDTVCTQIFGGPQTATVSGTVAGTPVTAQFSRQDGCQIDRWDALQPLLVVQGGA